ncbi:MAG TPA: hypothetical protein VHH90_07750 [Polyangia bacterium]|nr:hypothetical protein [Polyangia bacterium]
MGDDDNKKPGATLEDAAPEPAADDPSGRSDDRRISDFVRRAVSAGVGAARSSKDDIMRAAAGEVRNWLEHLNLNDEVAKALSKMVIEVKTEIRFRPAEDGRMIQETTNEVKVKPPSR